MLLLFEDFVEFSKCNRRVKPTQILRLNTNNHFEVTMTGKVFNRSSDRRYVLDNLRGRATHVELKEDDKIIFTMFPKLQDVIINSDINLPPGEFLLMQDVYQLPDSGSWETENKVPFEEAEQREIILNAWAHQYQGTLIDNQTINNLRRRTSYIRQDNDFIRSRNTVFKVRRRPMKTLFVVDEESTQEAIINTLEANPVYKVEFYVLAENEVNLEHIDSGKVEKIGLMRHLISNRLKPDIILFEPHREVQKTNTEKIIAENSNRHNLKFKFKGITCGLVDFGKWEAAALDKQVMDSLKAALEEVVITEEETTFAPSGSGDSDGSGTNNEGNDDKDSGTGIHRKLTAFRYDARELLGKYGMICNYLGFDHKKIMEKIAEYKARAGQYVLQLVEQKWLKSCIGEDVIEKMQSDQFAQAVTEYVKKYADRVTRVRSSLFYEILLKDTISLYKKTYAREKGSRGEEMLRLEQQNIEFAVKKAIREAYLKEDEDISDIELISLYERDFNKLVDGKLVSFIAVQLQLKPV